MMSRGLPDHLKHADFGIGPEDILQRLLDCRVEDIEPRVILTPTWGAEVFRRQADSLTTVSEGRVWRLLYRETAVTVILSGLGAPQTGDIALSLAGTRCETLLLCGSVGGLDPSMKLGDIMVVDVSLAGDGFSRFLSPAIYPADCFLESASPHDDLTDALVREAEIPCRVAEIGFHRGRVFSIDSILAQFSRLEWLNAEHGCIGIEMETSAVFRVADLLGIKAAALLQVSDVMPARKSLFAGTSETEHERRRRLRSDVLAKIALQVLTQTD